MDATDCPVCRRPVAPGAAVCSLTCGAVLVTQLKAPKRPLLRLVPPLAEESANEAGPSEAKPLRPAAA